VAKLVAEFLGRFLLSLTDFATVNQHIVLVRNTIDGNGPERKRIKPHPCPSDMIRVGRNQRIQKEMTLAPWDASVRFAGIWLT
jgi:hypothetical protein